MVEIKAQDLKGAKFKVKLMNWQARIFQHEYDHLQVSNILLFSWMMIPGVSL